MKKRIHVVDNALCSGCRNCELWCSFGKEERNEFNPRLSRIRIWRDPQGVMNVPSVDCGAENCTLNKSNEPICIEMCPTGVLVYTDLEDLIEKRKNYHLKKEEQPLFRLITPWKYPYPTAPWPSQED